MDIQTFRQMVDGVALGIKVCRGDIQQMYNYVGLEQGSFYTGNEVSVKLYEQIRASFVSGHLAVWLTCKSLRTDLIREHVLHNTSLDPYFMVLDHLQDAMIGHNDSQAPIDGDWGKAIQSAYDHAQIQDRGVANRERIHARDFMVARAARFLRDAGFAIHLEPGSISLKDEAENRLVSVIEDLIASIGGINVARRIFKALTPQYNVDQQRYHVVLRTRMVGGGTPQIPWGYLVQLSAKHARGRKPYIDTDAQWRKLCDFSQAFGAVIDVQHYAPTFYITMNAFSLLPFLQKTAIYDTMFCIPQLRPTDIVRIARGVLGWLDTTQPTKAGWSIDQVLDVISYLFSSAHDIRGPLFIDEKDVRHACPRIPPEIITKILREILSHPITGANRKFSRPTDAPIPENPNLRDMGHDFFLRPLLCHSDRQFILLDRSVCAPACLEALLTSLRSESKKLDANVGLAIEHFLKMEFASHGVYTTSGDYDAAGEHGECDLVIEVPETVIFSEVKKKALTRRAKAGSDAHLLLDLAGSLLAAQAQAGGHEVRLRRHGYLDLKLNGIVKRLELNGREIERVAISLFDFGSFQDRILLKQFLESTLNVIFTPTDTTLNKDFDDINRALVRVRDQISELYKNQVTIRQPFFNCWFLSVPQILVMLDGVTNDAAFKAELWSFRHLVTDSSDVYYDMYNARRMRGESLNSAKPVSS